MSACLFDKVLFNNKASCMFVLYAELNQFCDPLCDTIKVCHLVSSPKPVMKA